MKTGIPEREGLICTSNRAGDRKPNAEGLARLFKVRNRLEFEMPEAHFGGRGLL